MCDRLAQSLTNWNPLEHRLRCLGHIINIAAQAFLFARNEEAVDYAIQQAGRSSQSIDDELAGLSQTGDEGGWITTAPLKEIHSFGTTLR